MQLCLSSHVVEALVEPQQLFTAHPVYTQFVLCNLDSLVTLKCHQRHCSPAGLSDAKIFALTSATQVCEASCDVLCNSVRPMVW